MHKYYVSYLPTIYRFQYNVVICPYIYYTQYSHPFIQVNVLEIPCVLYNINK